MDNKDFKQTPQWQALQAYLEEDKQRQVNILSQETDIHNMARAQGALSLLKFLTAQDMLERVVEYQANLRSQEKKNNA